MQLYLLITMAYMIGSINGAIISSRIFNLSDPRAEGSKNPGATNMYRIHGRKPALTAFLLDFLKAILVISLSPKSAVIYTASAVCIGHIFPIFHGFKGGKGVAVTAGIICAVSMKIMLLVTISWLVTYKLTKISSIAATVAAIICLASQLIIPEHALIIPCLVILLSHKSNYQRLIQGSEA